MDYRLSGKITGTHGIKGGLKIQNYSDFDRFSKGKFIYLNINNVYTKFKVASKSDYKSGYIITLEGLLDINLVEKYVGYDIYSLPSDDDLEEDEYYYTDLIGKDIYNEENVLRCKVKDIVEYPQGPMLVCEVDKKLRYIPFNNQFIKEVLEDRIIIKEIEGLL